MKSFITKILIIVLILLTLIYVLMFTSFGNNLLKPYIQGQIDKYSPVSLKLNNFNIRFNKFNFSLESPKCIQIISNGRFSLFTRTIDSKIDVMINCHKNNHSILIENFIKGSLDKMDIYTTSNIEHGEAKVYTKLNNFKLYKIDAAIDKIDISTLLNLFTNEPYVDGLLNANINIISDAKDNITGSISTVINNGEIQRSVKRQNRLQKHPITKFRAELNADLNGKTINHAFILVSGMGNIESSGITTMRNLRTNSIYDINIHNLTPLSSIMKIPMSGNFRTNGRMVGTYKWIDIIGDTNFASSNTSYNLSLKNYKQPVGLTLKSKNLKLDLIFKTLGVPVYARGNMDIDMSIKHLSDKLDGIYKHHINGYILKDNVDKSLINLVNDIKFTNKTNIILEKNEGLLNSETNSDILNFHIKDATLQIKNKNINAPYQLNINNIKNIALTSNVPNNNFKIEGEVKYIGAAMDISFASTIYPNGKINGRYKNNIIDTNLININSIWLLDMLGYPRIFMSNINGKIAYNMLTNRGNIELILSDGRFLDNKLTSLLKNITNFNMKNELYENIGITGSFDRQSIKTNANLTSKNSKIEMNNTVINFKKNTIYSNISIGINKYKLNTTISGAITNPNIKINTKDLRKSVVNNILYDVRINDNKNDVKEEIKTKATNIINNLFNR